MKFGLAMIGLGGAAVIALAAWSGLRAIGHEVVRADWVVPLTTALLFGQLYICGLAWSISVGLPRPTGRRYLFIRWIREAVNSLLPVAQLGGNIVGMLLLAQRGVPASLAAAGTTLDLTIEAGTQFLFTVAGFLVLANLESQRDWHDWMIWALVPMALGLAGFILAQRIGLLRIFEWMARRLSAVFPALSVDALRGLHDELMRLQGNGTAIAKASALHLLAWSLGTAETWLILVAMGHSRPLAQAFVIESLGMAARSAGFAVPGALGVQEAGFVVVGELFGMHPDTAIALSMVKRARELAVGLPGLIAWQWSEGRFLVSRRRANPL
jgi:putative membrane protein